MKRSKCSILLGLFKHVQELSAVKKVLETIVFLALGSFGTLDPKLSHGTSSKFADVRTHLRKVSKITLYSIRGSWSKGQLPFFTLTSCLSRSILSLIRWREGGTDEILSYKMVDRDCLSCSFPLVEFGNRPTAKRSVSNPPCPDAGCRPLSF